MQEFPHIPFQAQTFNEKEMLQRSHDFLENMQWRRSLRFFSDRPVPKEIIENIVMTASTAPSGAHKQPWTFCIVGDPAVKAKIREAAEEEERESYNGRMSEEWLRDLAPLGTDWQKPFLEIAPWLIIVFKKAYEMEGGERRKCYYVNESVGIACGFLLAAIHQAGLGSLTHTPSPMNFLQRILDRPDNERPYLLIPVGYPAEGATVPDLRRKTLEQVSVWY
ncbi:MAG: nitroreductase family protein [Saprospiraceae bacterium]|nr:nitroreductase family protein [Saprospiraceae bacterium]